MKSLLYDELRELARKILEAPEGEISSLQGDARVLYEKLTVLRYTEGLVEELRQSMEMDGEEPVEEPQYVEPAGDDHTPEMPDEQAKTFSEQQDEEQLPEDTSENQEDGMLAEPQPEIGESVAQTTVTTVEQTVAVVQDDDTVTVEKTVRVAEKKTIDKSYDDIQQSLFGDDLFTKELDFDPDEDLFEDKTNTEVVVDEVPSPDEDVVSGATDHLEAAIHREEAVSIETTDIPSDGVEEPQEEERENEPASFFSFQVVQEEAETENSDVGPVAEENKEESDPEEMAPEEAFASQKEPEEEPEKDMLQQRVPEPEEMPADVPESENGQTEEPAERSRTVNDTVAQKEEKRPSLNEILAASDVKMDLNDRIAFINHLFDGDAEAFETSVSYIFSLTDIDVANEYIIEILKPSYNNWFEKEKYERRFAEIVLRHFMNKK